MATKVTRWQADDGALFERKCDAVARERAARKSKAGTKWFLLEVMCAYYDDDWKAWKRGRMPPGAWIDGGWVLYHWGVNASQETAIRKAAERCQALRRRTGLDWRIDEDMHIGPGCDAANTVYLGEHPLLMQEDLLH